MKNGIDEEVIDETIHIATQKVGYMYLKKEVENLYLVRAYMHYNGTKACKVFRLQMTTSVNMFFVLFFKRKFG